MNLTEMVIFIETVEHDEVRSMAGKLIVTKEGSLGTKFTCV